jgi:hypothetical protein
MRDTIQGYASNKICWQERYFPCHMCARTQYSAESMRSFWAFGIAIKKGIEPTYQFTQLGYALSETEL